MNQHYRLFLFWVLLMDLHAQTQAQIWTQATAYRESARLSPASTLVRTTDGYYEVGLYSMPTAGLPPSRGDQDVFVRKVGADGQTEWTRAYGGPGAENDHAALAVVQVGKLKLAAGVQIAVQVLSQGMTTRLEVDRTPGDLYGGYTSAIAEFCGQTTSAGTRKTLLNFSPDEASPAYDEQCSEVVDSYAPNDKQALPIGVGQEHTTLFTDWVEYTIRFENTGTDTAFVVEVRDSLNPALDLSTVRFGAMSHKFETRLLVSPNPAHNLVRLESSGSNGWLEAYTPDSRQVQRIRVQPGHVATLQRGSEACGWMLLRWKTDLGGVTTQKLIWK